MEDATTARIISNIIIELSTASRSLPASIPVGVNNAENKLWRVINDPAGEDDWQIFNKRFDRLFGEDCLVDGRFPALRRGKYGMDAVCTYLKSITWDPQTMMLDLARKKLERLLGVVKDIVYAFFLPSLH